MRKRILALALLAAGALAATALATPIIGMVTAETARGELDDRLQVNTRFDNGARVKLNTKGPIEIIMQRVVVPPGGSLGWHTHPGENVNVVAQGTLTLYHAKKCTMAMPYGVGDSFATHPEGRPPRTERRNGGRRLLRDLLRAEDDPGASRSHRPALARGRGAPSRTSRGRAPIVGALPR